MSQYEALDKVWEDIRRCYRCGYCREMIRDLTGTFHPCPVRENLRFEHFCARGRNTIARGLVLGDLVLSYELRDVVYTCLACGGCQDSCSLIDWAKVDTPAITQAMRVEIHRLGMTPKRLLSVQQAKATQQVDKATCQIACPIDQDVPSYVGLIKHGRYAEALEVIRQTNPLPSICGRACVHPCEWSCRQAEIGEPISIMGLKRFAVDFERANGSKRITEKVSFLKRGAVAIVGSGPAGLTAANYLARRGFEVTIFDRHESPGGMMAYGIPDFILPREALAYDLQRIKDLGVIFKMGVEIGEDKTLEELLDEGFKAVLLCLGTWEPRGLSIFVEEMEGVWKGLDFLRRAKSGEKLSLPARLTIIGGGNLAIDVARTALRFGAKEVELVCLEGWEEMPAHSWKVEAALEEGVMIHNCWGVKNILGSGRVQAVELKACTAVFDAEGRFNPCYDEQKTKTLKTDMVVTAIGQGPDLSCLSKGGDFPRKKDGTLPIGRDFRIDGRPIFAAGDVVQGSRSIIEAMASGRDAAVAIENYLQTLGIPGIEKSIEVRASTVRELELDPDRINASREKMHMIGTRRRRRTFAEVEKGFSALKARREAGRCLQCDLARFTELPIHNNTDQFFFVGCNDRFRFPEVARSALRILSRLGLKVNLAAEECCCGSPAFWSGNMSLAEELKAKNIKLFRSMGVKKIITACSDCLGMLKNFYMLDEEGMAVEHFVQTIAGPISEGRLLLNGYRGKVTYHDPCQLVRKGQVVEEPRTILTHIEGLELVEMTRTKRGTSCCGGGPNRLVHLTSPQLAGEIAQDRIQEAQGTQAQALVTTCPWCRSHFESLQGNGLKIYDLPYFIDQVVGLKSEGK